MQDNQHIISLVHFDQPRVHISQDIVDAFNQLDLVSNEIFDKILKRISENSKRLKNLNNRAAVVQAKIDMVRGSSKATKVFSASQFPGDGDQVSPKLLFGAGDSFRLLPSRTQIADKALERPDCSSIKDRLEFFHVRNSVEKEDVIPPNATLDSALPLNLSSISSLYLFNTNHIPFGSNRIVDPFVKLPLKVSRKSRSANEVLIEPPKSIVEGDAPTMMASKDEFQYLPDLADLPDLDLPTELPSLPGVADDLSYITGPDTGIAPSIDLPDLPSENEAKVVEKSGEPLSPPPLLTESKEPLEENFVGSDDSISQKETVSPRQVERVVETALPLPQPPPPPPPPPPILSLKVSESVSDNSVGEPTIPYASTDTRMDLMNAIKNAGGAAKANLKKTSITKKESKKSVALPSGDLMSDLISKLSQRRKGISGGEKRSSLERDNRSNSDVMPGDQSSEVNASNTMQRMSSIIPPPLSNDEDDHQDSNTEDDSWE